MGGGGGGVWRAVGPQGASCQEIWHQGQGWCLMLTQPSDGDDKRPESPLKLPLHSAFIVRLTSLRVSAIEDLIHFLLLEPHKTQHDVWHLIYTDKHWPFPTICSYPDLLSSSTHHVVFSVCDIHHIKLVARVKSTPMLFSMYAHLIMKIVIIGTFVFRIIVLSHHLSLTLIHFLFSCPMLVQDTVPFGSVISIHTHINTNTHTKTLTCHLQRCIATDCLAQVIARHAHIDSFVRLASPPVHNSQEKEGSTGE